MTDFEQYLISELVEIKVSIERLAYELKDKDSCPNKFDIFDKTCMSCPYGDVCHRDED